MKTIIAILISSFLFLDYSIAQKCTELGQNPSSAFPVCGTQIFTQATVPLCGISAVPTPCSDGALYSDRNPYWYKFTCFQGGSLGFVITPSDLNDDYDWQLFDVTNHQPDDVYTDKSLFVACNWSENPGTTGASPNVNGLINCAGKTFPKFSSMPNLIKGHNYLLLISHYTQTQSGYQLNFGGGTAVITDPTKALFTSANVTCDGLQLSLKVNKKMRCASLDSDGSDFKLVSNSKIIKALGNTCQTSFDVDSIILSLDVPINPGKYTVSIQKGNDGNTLLDICDTPMDEGSSIDFVVTPYLPPVMDSVGYGKCPPDVIIVRFDKSVDCSSVDPDGSDFKIIGPSPVTIAGVTGSCDITGAGTIFTIQLSSQISLPGNYVLQIQKGNDGNTALGTCGGEVINSSFPFTVAPTVSAKFSFTSNYNCLSDQFTFENSGENINTWIWTSNGIEFGNKKKVTRVFTTDSSYDVKLFVSNGGCNDTQDTVLNLKRVKAIFTATPIICPTDTVFISNLSIGNILSYQWNFDNGNTSTLKDPPPQQYPFIKKEHYYTITLSVVSPGCTDSTSQKIRVLNNCYIDLPNSFTPNGDGVNDYFYPLNAFKADNLTFMVYNRWGNKVFESHDWTKKWDGTFKGNPQSAGVYIWYMDYKNHDTQIQYHKKGTVLLIR